jgi:ribosome-associated protein
MQANELKALVLDALDELKAHEVVVLDVAQHSGFTDYMVVATGTSNRHVKSLADNLQRRCREQAVRPLGVEGEQAAEWILVDLGDVVVHLMQPQTRAFYNLEKFWSLTEMSESAAARRQHGQ